MGYPASSTFRLPFPNPHKRRNSGLDITVRSSHELEGGKILALKKLWLHAVQADTNAIGFLPTKAFDIRSEQNDLYTVERNGDCVGWCLVATSHHTAVLRVYQIWVRPDARIIEHGRALIQRLIERGEKTGMYAIRAWVAQDLPANLFWEAVGFSKLCWRYGQGGKNRKHWLWSLPLSLQRGKK